MSDDPSQLDRRHVWHPFTQMRDWMEGSNIVVAGGKGSYLEDLEGRRYLDANSSIWTNLHGHQNRAINRAIKRQLDSIAHSSALGLANVPASLLAGKLVEEANPAWVRKSGQPALEKVFYSDDGSTAIETALKMCHEHQRRSGRASRPRFISMGGAYHGDTIGGVSLGQSATFHGSFRGLCFKTERLMSPYCYRCPFNKAKPERTDARWTRRCRWECVDDYTGRIEKAQKAKKPLSGLILEPLMQGAAGMIAQPRGWLSRIGEISRGNGMQIIADEVMTGFGRTGIRNHSGEGRRTKGPLTKASLFAMHAEGVQPDFLCLAKGLTGGYLPMAATLTTRAVFDSFLGSYESMKTFFHGHSYTGNQLGAVASLASLDLLRQKRGVEARRKLEMVFSEALASLWEVPQVGDIRQEGLMAGIELVSDWKTREAYPLKAKAGIRVCQKMAELGVLTRPVGNVIVLMPTYSFTDGQVRRMVEVVRKAIGLTLT